MRNLIKLSLVLWLTTMLCSCASVSVLDTWRNPGLQGTRLQKVLVVNLARKDTSRMVYEDMLVNELSRHGVEAVASYAVLPGASLPDWHELDRAVRRSGAQAVLTIQTIKIEKETRVEPSPMTSYPGYWYPRGFPDWNFPGYYHSMALYGPTYISTYDVATLQVNLFDAGSDKLLWASTMQTYEPESVTKVGKDLARKVVKELAQEGLI